MAAASTNPNGSLRSAPPDGVQKTFTRVLAQTYDWPSGGAFRLLLPSGSRGPSRGRSALASNKLTVQRGAHNRLECLGLWLAGSRRDWKISKTVMCLELFAFWPKKHKNVNWFQFVCACFSAVSVSRPKELESASHPSPWPLDIRNPR